MCPIVGFAEDSSRADVSATEEVQAGLLDANDSHVDVPDDALSVSSNISLDGTSKDDTGSIAGGDASVSDDEVSDEDASDGLVVSSADTDAAEGAEDDQPATEASTEPGPNPFKGGVDAQNLAALDNYECGNYSELDKSLMWKTSASCSGKKM
ncbi:MAG: hypothetical protein ACLTQI_05955 [Slackia sp.]